MNNETGSWPKRKRRLWTGPVSAFYRTFVIPSSTNQSVDNEGFALVGALWPRLSLVFLFYFIFFFALFLLSIATSVLSILDIQKWRQKKTNHVSLWMFLSKLGAVAFVNPRALGFCNSCAIGLQLRDSTAFDGVRFEFGGVAFVNPVASARVKWTFALRFSLIINGIQTRISINVNPWWSLWCNSWMINY